MARFVAGANRAHTQTYSLNLYLRRLEEFSSNSSRRAEVFSAAKSHYVGTRKGPRCKVELEKLFGRYLVFHRQRGLLLRRRSSDAEAEGDRTVYTRER